MSDSPYMKYLEWSVLRNGTMIVGLSLEVSGGNKSTWCKHT